MKRDWRVLELKKLQLWRIIKQLRSKQERKSRRSTRNGNKKKKR
jgi:hypothetical protein